MVLIRFSAYFTISSWVSSRMVVFPSFFSRFFWEGYHAAPQTQFLRHYYCHRGEGLDSVGYFASPVFSLPLLEQGRGDRLAATLSRSFLSLGERKNLPRGDKEPSSKETLIPRPCYLARGRSPLP